MHKLILLAGMLFSSMLFSQTYFCELELDKIGENTQQFDIKTMMTNEKVFQYNNFEIKVHLERDGDIWELNILIFDYKQQKESLYEAHSVYELASSNPPYAMFAEVFVRDVLSAACSCQKI